MRLSMPTGSKTIRCAAQCCALGALLTNLAGCEPMARPEVTVDCAAAERDIVRDTLSPDYFSLEIKKSGDLWTPAALYNNNDQFFCFADGTEGGYPADPAPFLGGGCAKPLVEPIDDGNGFCPGFTDTGEDASGNPVTAMRHRSALVIRSGHHEFYGAEFATWGWNTGGVPNPSLGWVPEGIAFWARSEADSDKVVTLYLNNTQSGAPSDTVPGTTYSPTLAKQGREAGCVPGLGNAASSTPGATVTVGSTDPNVQTNTSNLQLAYQPGQCGNRWRRLLETTEDWQLYLLPFDTFYQEARGDRSQKPLDPTEFYGMAFGIGRGSAVSLWVDEIFFYRKKTAEELAQPDADAGP